MSNTTNCTNSVSSILTCVSSRHADTIVYRDPQTNQLVPFHHNQEVDRRSPKCPTCGRAWHSRDEASTHGSGGDEMEDQPSFITRDYFDMLARSLPNSNENSSPPSPRRRIAQPVRSRLHPSAATSQTPPPVAEFVGSEPAPAAQSHGISETAFSPNYFEKFFVEEGARKGRSRSGVTRPACP